MAKANDIFSWILRFFDDNDLPYDTVDGRPSIKIMMPLDGKIKSTNMYITARDWSFTVNSYLPLSAEEDCRAAIAEYFTRVNYGMIFGKFEMDYEDGELRYTLSMDCEDRTGLSDSLMRSVIYMSRDMIEKYGDGLAAVMYGFMTPAQACEEAEKKKD